MTKTTEAAVKEPPKEAEVPAAPQEQTTALAPLVYAGGIPADMADEIYSDGNQDQGFTKDDLTIPFLSILQDLSPQVKRTKAKFIEGASPGMICNTVTGDLYDGEKGVFFAPAHFSRGHVEFKPRGTAGATNSFVANHGSDDSIVAKCRRDEKGRLVTPDGNDLVVSMNYYGMVYDESTESFKQCVISLAGTQFKKGRPWNTLISSLQIPVPKQPGRTFNPPMFYQLYHLTSQPESNESGDWYGWKIKSYKPIFEMPGGADAYRRAKALRELVLSGAAQIETPDADDGYDPARRDTGDAGDYESQSNYAAQGGGMPDDEIPF